MRFFVGRKYSFVLCCVVLYHRKGIVMVPSIVAWLTNLREVGWQLTGSLHRTCVAVAIQVLGQNIHGIDYRKNVIVDSILYLL